MFSSLSSTIRTFFAIINPVAARRLCANLSRRPSLAPKVTAISLNLVSRAAPHSHRSSWPGLSRPPIDSGGAGPCAAAAAALDRRSLACMGGRDKPGHDDVGVFVAVARGGGWADPAAMIRIGVDFGGTKIEAAALDASGAVLSRVRLPNPGAYEPALQAVAEVIARAQAEAGAR